MHELCCRLYILFHLLTLIVADYKANIKIYKVLSIFNHLSNEIYNAQCDYESAF